MPKQRRDPEKVFRSEAMLDVAGDISEASETVGAFAPPPPSIDSRLPQPASDNSRKVHLALRNGLVELRLSLCAEVNRLEDLVSSSLQGLESPDPYMQKWSTGAHAASLMNGTSTCAPGSRRHHPPSPRSVHELLGKQLSNGSLPGKDLRTVADMSPDDIFAEALDATVMGKTSSQTQVNGVNSRGPFTIEALHEEEETIMKRRASEAHVATISSQSKVRGFSLRDNKKKDAYSNRLQKITRSRKFDMFFTFLILTNSILLAAQVQYGADHLGQPEPLVFPVANYVCNAAFVLELILRICAEGPSGIYCDRKNLRWAILDTAVVLVSVLEAVSDIIAAAQHTESSSLGASGSNMRMLRMIRVMRVLRTFRAFRLIKHLSALQTLLFSIFATLKSLAWASLLMLAIIYVFAIAFTQCASEPDSADPPLTYYWGSLDTSMSTLFQVMTNGISWREAYEALYRVSWTCGWLFNFFVVFMYFVMLNVITGVFCNSAIESAQKNPELIAHSLMQNRKTYIENLNRLFEAVDTDGSGTITIVEFEELLRDDMAHAHFQALELNISDAWTLFKLIDHDGSGTISISEFLTGCEALKGGARSIDVASILYETRRASRKLFDYVGRIEAILMHAHKEEIPKKSLPSAPSAIHQEGESLMGMRMSNAC